LKLSISSGFARFGWMNVPAPDWQAYVWWGAIVVLTFSGLWSILKAPLDQRQKVQLVVLFIWTVGVAATYLRLNMNRFQPQFRYAFPLLSVITLFAATGYRRLWKRGRWSANVPLIVLVTGLIVINVYLILFVIGPVYAHPVP